MTSSLARQSVVINAPNIVVWSFVYAMNNWPEWCTALSEITLHETPKNDARGSFRVEHKSKPRPFRIALLERQKRLIFTMPVLWLELGITVRVLDVAEGVAVTLDAQLSGFLSRLISVALRGWVARLFAASTAELRSAIEIDERSRFMRS